MYKKLKYYNKNRKTIVDFAMAPIGHHSCLSLLRAKPIETSLIEVFKNSHQA